MECLICNNIVFTLVSLNCSIVKHEACITCFTKIIEHNRKCPYCRKKIEKPTITIGDTTQQKRIIITLKTFTKIAENVIYAKNCLAQSYENKGYAIINFK